DHWRTDAPHPRETCHLLRAVKSQLRTGFRQAGDTGLRQRGSFAVEDQGGPVPREGRAHWRVQVRLPHRPHRGMAKHAVSRGGEGGMSAVIAPKADAETGHWYRRDGTPCYTVPNKTGG